MSLEELEVRQWVDDWKGMRKKSPMIGDALILPRYTGFSDDRFSHYPSTAYWSPIGAITEGRDALLRMKIVVDNYMRLKDE